jgi:methionyl aminopeptidase
MSSHKIILKSPGEIAKLRKAGEVAARILMDLGAEVQAGRTTGELDQIAKELFKREGCKNAFYGYHGYPGQVCISVNEVVVHGIGGHRMIHSGDIVSIDVGTIVDGWVGDNAMTVPVGLVEPDRLKLLAATEESLFRAIQLARPGVPLADVCAAVEAYVKPLGFTVVRDFVGHGVCRSMHEEPQVPNYRPNWKLPRLKPGMVIAIEPMVNMGRASVRILDDDWTVVTADGKPSAHFEHTIAITDGDPIILTERPRIALPEQLGITL